MTWKPFQQAVAGFDGLQNCDPDTVDCESTANDQNALVRATAEIEDQCGNGKNKIMMNFLQSFLRRIPLIQKIFRQYFQKKIFRDKFFKN